MRISLYCVLYVVLPIYELKLVWKPSHGSRRANDTDINKDTSTVILIILMNGAVVNIEGWCH